MFKMQLFFFFLLLNFSCLSLGQITSRSKGDAAFGVPSQFPDSQLPTYLDVGKHSLWRFMEMKSSTTGLVTHRAVASKVASDLQL